MGGWDVFWLWLPHYLSGVIDLLDEMARALDPKCLACSQLSVAEARQIHGPEGDNCWNQKRCPRRRSHYRNRRESNAKRRAERQQAKVAEMANSGVETVAIQKETAPVAYLYLYRERRKDAPLHAIAASVWWGEEKVLEVEPIHCAGLRNRQIQRYLERTLGYLRTRYGITKFEPEIRLELQECPMKDCPLKSTPSEVGINHD